MGTIITISGVPGSGKSTIGRMLATRLNIPFFSTGDIFRQMARKNGCTVQEFWVKVKKDPSLWDKKIDAYQSDLPKQYDSFVIDSRLGWHFIPQSKKIYLDISLKEAAKRIMEQNRSEESWTTVEEGIELIRKRIENERSQYNKMYGIDHHDKKNYDFIVDATGKNPLDKVEKILKFMERVP